MALAIAAVVRRHMKRTEAFHVPSGAVQPPAILELEAGEELVGWYANPDASYVVFTNAAILVLDGERRARVALAEIVSYDLPQSKTEAQEVVVQTLRGRTSVPIRGRHGPANRYSDAWNLVQVLHTIVSVRANPERGA